MTSAKMQGPSSSPAVAAAVQRASVTGSPGRDQTDEYAHRLGAQHAEGERMRERSRTRQAQEIHPQLGNLASAAPQRQCEDDERKSNGLSGGGEPQGKRQRQIIALAECARPGLGRQQRERGNSTSTDESRHAEARDVDASSRFRHEAPPESGRSAAP